MGSSASKHCRAWFSEKAPTCHSPTVGENRNVVRLGQTLSKRQRLAVEVTGLAHGRPHNAGACS